MCVCVCVCVCMCVCVCVCCVCACVRACDKLWVMRGCVGLDIDGRASTTQDVGRVTRQRDVGGGGGGGGGGFMYLNSVPLPPLTRLPRSGVH